MEEVDIYKPFKVKECEDRTYLAVKDEDIKLFECLTMTTTNKKNAKKIHCGYIEVLPTGILVDFFAFNRNFKTFISNDELIQVEGWNQGK